MERCELTVLPEEVGQLARLKRLILYNNTGGGLIGRMVGLLAGAGCATELEVLNLRYSPGLTALQDLQSWIDRHIVSVTVAGGLRYIITGHYSGHYLDSSRLVRSSA